MREWGKQMPFSANLHIRPAGKFEVKNVNIEQIIEERGKNYGSFDDVATMSQQLKAVLLDTNTQLKPHQKEAGEMICLKLARIFAGRNPDYEDNWRDIAGYAVLGGQLNEK
ncbi:hypothetical protein GM698_10185 [Mannheimia sp. ZY171111]|nr:hypothetical protein GM698_10185 [Mannheimia sp. ZY171111]